MKALPRWARVALVALWIVCTASFVAVVIFSGDIVTFLSDRVGMTAVMVGSLVGTAILIWIARRFDD